MAHSPYTPTHHPTEAPPKMENPTPNQGLEAKFLILPNSSRSSEKVTTQLPMVQEI
jgi:hypothetical protein